MKSHRRLAILLSALVAPAAALGTATALADGDRAPAPPSASPAPSVRPVANARPKRPSKEFVAACALGTSKYVAHDYPAAVEAFGKATTLSPKDPLGYYLLGEAQLAAGNPSDADAAWARAGTESESDPGMHGRVLFVVADLRERQQKWDEAKAAWDAYRQWLNANPKVNGFPASPEARIKAIDRMLEQDKAYEIVRKRIEETKDGGVYNDVAAPAPAPH
jgi:tetratricopeptide (TPR) repeat protein